MYSASGRTTPEGRFGMPSQSTCSIEGCLSKAHSRGWCSLHWSRWHRWGDPAAEVRIRGTKPKPISERFFAFVNRDGPIPEHRPELGKCHVWTGATDSKGYGQIGSGSQVDGTRGHVAAHRQAWEFEHGPVPEGLSVLHHCDNPPCVRGSHLFVGTHLDNMSDMVSKGRHGSRVRR